MKEPVTLKVNADRLIMQALEEDITSEDISTNAVMPGYQKGRVELICKQDGIIAGLEVFCKVFELLDDTVTFEMHVKDGDAVKKGDLMAVVTGDIRALLSGADKYGKFPSEDEWDCDLYAFDCRAFKRQQNDFVRYQENNSQYAYL